MHAATATKKPTASTTVLSLIRKPIFPPCPRSPPYLAVSSRNRAPHFQRGSRRGVFQILANHCWKLRTPWAIELHATMPMSAIAHDKHYKAKGLPPGQAKKLERETVIATPNGSAVMREPEKRAGGGGKGHGHGKRRIDVTGALSAQILQTGCFRPVSLY